METQEPPQRSWGFRPRRGLQRRALRAAMGSALFFVAQPLLAGTLTVNSFDSEVDPTDGDCTLREAITAANTDAPSGLWLGECAAGSGADTIVLTGDVMLDEVDNNGDVDGYNGLPEVTTSITIQGNGWRIERDDSAPAFRLFRVARTGNLTLKNTTVANGFYLGHPGGGIFNKGTLTLVDSTVSGNTSNGAGGIFNFGSRLTLVDSAVTGNTAQFGAGVVNWRTLDVVRSTISDNTSSFSFGGGVVNYGRATLTDSTLSNNRATSGDAGGIFNTGVLTLARCVLAQNSASDDSGAIRSSGTTTLIDTTLRANNALHGGGISVIGGKLNVTRSTLVDNAAFSGGGIEVQWGSASVINSTLSHNLAVDGTGGAINNLGGSVALTHSTIMGSVATQGGAGIHNEGESVTLASSIVADSAGPNCSGTVTDGGNNFDDDGTCPRRDVISLIDANLDDNGGPTRTHALLPGSAALNTTFPCLQVIDQRGGWRDFLCDSGAFELGVDDEYEHSGVGGDDACPGHQIQYGRPEHHLLLDEDWVWFDVQVGATYEIETGGLHGSPPADTWLDLRRNCTTHLASDDNSGVDNAAKITYTATNDDAVAGGLDVRVQEVVAYDYDIGYDLSVTCIANCPPCSASGFNILQLFDETVLTFRFVEACQKIWVGRTGVTGGATLMLRAGEEMQFDDGFSVWRGGELAVEIAPYLLVTP